MSAYNGVVVTMKSLMLSSFKHGNN